MMKYYQIAGTDLKASNMILGCMRLTRLSQEDAKKHIFTAMDQGINFFDHADIYGKGECETLFSKAVGMNPTIREKMILQSKCGIVNGYYDFSKGHILKSVDGILGRLHTEYLDVLLLHRPDTLMDPEEVAEAFQVLRDSGKVRYFGVSNQNPGQIELLQKFTPHKLAFNQLQLSIAHTPIIDSGLAANMDIGQSIERTGGILEYCRLKGITIQAWSPFQQGFFKGPFLGDLERYPELNQCVREISEKYGVADAAVAAGWITRHPANIQVVLGTMNHQRLIDACAGADLPLTREEWYKLYKAAGNTCP